MWTTASWRGTPASSWTRGTPSPAAAGRAYERRRHRHGVRGARGRGVSRRDGQRCDLRRRRRAQDRAAAPEPAADLRARARAVGDAQPARWPPPVHDRRARSDRAFGYRLHRGRDPARRGRLCRPAARAGRGPGHRAAHESLEDRRHQEYRSRRHVGAGTGGGGETHERAVPGVLQPRVPQGGRRRRGFHEAGPRDRGRGFPGGGPGDRRALRPVRAHRQPDHFHGHPVGGDDEVRGQRDARDPHLVHEPDRPPVRDRRGGRDARSQGHRNRPADRLRLPVPRARLRRLLLPDGRQSTAADGCDESSVARRSSGGRARERSAEAGAVRKATTPLRRRPGGRDVRALATRRAGVILREHRPPAGVCVLVTGAASFLGSDLCDRLLGQGHRVVGMDNFVTGAPANVAHLRDQRDFQCVLQDVTNFLEVQGPLDGVLHFASPASPVDYLELPIQTLKVGSLGTHKALGLAKAKGARFLLASTSEVYGDPLVHPQPESYWGNVNPVGPRGVYDEAKRFAEAITMAYHRFLRVDTRIVRIFNTYGPRMRPRDGRVVSNFIVQALKGEPLTVYGDGSQTRSFCYVDDLVEGIVRLFERGGPEPTNIGNPTEFTVRQLAELVLRLTGSRSRTVEQPLPTDDPKVRQPDIQRARETLGWEPKVALEDGLRRTIEYFSRLTTA